MTQLFNIGTHDNPVAAPIDEAIKSSVYGLSNHRPSERTEDQLRSRIQNLTFLVGLMATMLSPEQQRVLMENYYEPMP